MLLQKFKSNSTATVDKCFLVFPGFNQNPLALMPIIDILKTSGYDVFLMDYPEDASETQSEFFFAKTLEFIKSMADKYQSISIFGFSFGGFWAKALDDHFAFERVIYMSPAFFLRRRSWALEKILFLFKKVPSMPLGNPDWESKYRKFLGGVPVNQYRFLFHSLQLFKNEIDKPPRAKYFILINANDELILFSEIKKWHQKQSDSLGQFYELKPKGALIKYKHLGFDENTLGAEEFSNLKKLIEKFVF